jgi:hypothetical protein
VEKRQSALERELEALMAQPPEPIPITRREPIQAAQPASEGGELGNAGEITLVDFVRDLGAALDPGDAELVRARNAHETPPEVINISTPECGQPQEAPCERPF